MHNDIKLTGSSELYLVPAVDTQRKRKLRQDNITEIVP
jgi:hypothetical protein